MSKKTKIIVIVVVVILAILVGIFTYKYIQKSNSTGTEWGDKYYIYLKEDKEKSAEERQINYGITELMENPKIQFCSFEQNKEPQMLISYMQDGRKCTNIYYINNDGNIGEISAEYTFNNDEMNSNTEGEISSVSKFDETFIKTEIDGSSERDFNLDVEEEFKNMVTEVIEGAKTNLNIH